MKNENYSYIKNLRFNESKLMTISIGLVLVGSAVIASPNCENIDGLLMIYSGIYCAAVAQEYRDMIGNYINNENKIKMLK